MDCVRGAVVAQSTFNAWANGSNPFERTNFGKKERYLPGALIKDIHEKIITWVSERM